MNEINWIYKCGNDWKYCKDGFCQRYNQLKEDGKNSAEYMSLEWEDKTGVKWSRDAIKQQFQALSVIKTYQPENEVEKLFKILKKASKQALKAIKSSEFEDNKKQLVTATNKIMIMIAEGAENEY